MYNIFRISVKRILLSAASVWVQKHALVLCVEEWEDRAGFPLLFCCLDASIGLPFLHSYLPITGLSVCFCGQMQEYTQCKNYESQLLLGAVSCSVCLQFIFQMMRSSQETLAGSCPCTAQRCSFSATTVLTISDGAARALGGRLPSNEM